MNHVCFNRFLRRVFPSALLLFLSSRIFLTARLFLSSVVLSVLLLAAPTFSAPRATVFIQSVDALGWDNLRVLQAKTPLKNSFFSFSNTYELQIEGTGNTGPVHATAFTGLAPEQGGWIANQFIVPGKPIAQTTSAFGSVKPIVHNGLVHQVKQKNLSIACLNVPTINLNFNCDLHLAFKGRLDESCSVVLGSGLTLSAASKRCLASTELNGEKRGDEFRLVHQYATLSIVFNQVIPLCWTENGKYFSRLLWREKVGEQDKLYIGAKHQTSANPVFYQQFADFACWPGVLDPNSMRLGKISETGFRHIATYQHNYAMALAKQVLGSNRYDVVVNYTSYLDSIQHEFWVDNNHADFQRYRNWVKQAYQQVSDDLNHIASQLKPQDNMLIFSDHGMQHAHSVVMINGLLRARGFAVHGVADAIAPSDANQPDMNAQLGSNFSPELGPKLSPKRPFKIRPKVRAVTSGALLHIYAEQGVSADTLNSLKTLLKSYRVSGEPLFTQVYDRSELVKSGLNHVNSGVLVAVTNKGFSLDPRMPPTERFVFPTVVTPSQLADATLSDTEKQFLLQGTPNRVSPGNHGFQSKTVPINGVVMGRGAVQHFLAENQAKQVYKTSGLLPLMMRAVNTLPTRSAPQ